MQEPTVFIISMYNRQRDLLEELMGKEARLKANCTCQVPLLAIAIASLLGAVDAVREAQVASRPVATRVGITDLVCAGAVY
jgi:hypothetical protein